MKGEIINKLPEGFKPKDINSWTVDELKEYCWKRWPEENGNLTAYQILLKLWFGKDIEDILESSEEDGPFIKLASRD